MFCPICGKEAKGSATFCVFCGERILQPQQPVMPAPTLLHCTGGELGGRQFQLTREGLMLGRDPSCQMVVSNPEISRRHVWIGLDEADRPLVIDQGSANGTFINDQQVSRAMLSPGDFLRVGVHTQITFKLESTQPAAVPAAAPMEKSRPLPSAPSAPQAPAAVPKPPEPRAVPPASMANRTIAEAAQFRVSKPRLQLIIDRYVVESYAVPEPGICIGRDPAMCTIVLEHPSISRLHARIEFKSGMVLLADEGSANGTMVNGKRVNEHILSEGDVITFGAYNEKSLIFRDSQRGKLTAKSLKLDRDLITIGRDPSNDVMLDHPMVSKFHARMMRSGGGFVLSDLGSLNGTFINGHKIQQQQLTPRDRIVIGPFDLKFDGAQVQHESQLGGLSIDALGVLKKVGSGLVLLDDISVSIQANDFVGLLGPSGAGKSTLMDALNGFRPATSGSVLVNGLDLYRSYDSLKSMIGYVPQDDIIHKQLTVYKCLYYGAKLRLPPDTPESEIDQIINEVLKTLELEERRNTLITKLSGGQRKRVNIGVELVTKPTLLFLDEPTSGLDPRTEAKMMALFRQLADQGRTVLLTTHVMASLTQLDKIIVLVKGKLAYFGPGAELTEYFGVDNPSDVFDKLETLSPQEWKERYLKSPLYAEYACRPQADKAKAPSAPAVAEKPAAKKGRAVDQFMVQTRRYSEIKFNDRIFSAILLIQAPLLAALDILVTTTNGARLLFLIIFGAIWYGFTNATREIVGEQPIYKRERQTGLGISSYVFSKIVVLAVIAMAQCLLTIGTLTLFGHLEGHFWLSLLLMFGTAFNGVLLGLLVSAMVRSTELAITFGVVALFPQILFAGLLVPLDNIQSLRKIDITARKMAEMSGKPVPPGSLGDVVVKTIEEPVTAIDGMSKPVQTISKAIVTRWGLEGLADLYRQGEKKYPTDYEGLLAIQNSYVTCLAWLAAIAVLLTIAILLVQKQKDVKT